MLPIDRRSFLAASALAASGGWPAPRVSGADSLRTKPPKRARPATKKVAVVCSIYHYLSHAYHITGRYFDGYMKGDEHHFPDFGIASAYVDQVKANDLSRELAKEHSFRLSESIDDALTLGTGKLAVDGVLLICEHGDYKYNDRGQKLYPRYEFFKKITAVFEKTGKSVPVFCDKHLSYDRTKAAEMVATAKKMRFSLMAGSSLPVTWRRPELEFKRGTKITEALIASRGELEIYGIHALEALQCMVERRFSGADPKPANQGVKAVTCLQGDAVWKAGDDGLWSWELLEHALGHSTSRNAGDVRANCRRFPRPATWGNFIKGPIAFLVEYADGLKATVLQLDGHVADETFAARVEGEKKPSSCLFWLPPPPGAAFLEALAGHTETLFATGKSPYPVERTQLTGGILDYAIESRATDSKRLETPDLDIRYDPPADSGFMRGGYAKPVK
ncbi:Uncharacterized protein OS=Singulisphaera acidiphila (strain ATCC BAA-1392 / DSM 18658 / VKM B-2454 / MOB10) GN=Sinac_1553 PE=4 SV=1 [Gemmata massiliana]|uniref:Uncharacterized protein n=1 Tax=Gemmata massiliana TaxID=1210884 RepID=A0A6P2D3T1_9BACT|nr:hypothetical protein [Gemmata massiliana]VTR95527.1 Uncharacterized protein OS=Singulisphaera acidiphila (strain ATCC BAA-1392 / DSM 18658 / VKM B-2454 / MOB10) GN=Sinac_1553 PE=4 SV=1 [Gemmata massiliana]